MARIQNPTHGLRLRAALGLREKHAVPIVSDELVPVIIVDDVTQDPGGNPQMPAYSGSDAVGAVAAQFSYVHYRNPPGSGVVAIFDAFDADSSGIANLAVGMLDPITLPFLNAGAFLLNRRGIPVGVSARAKLADYGGANVAAFVALGGALYQEYRCQADVARFIRFPSPMVAEPGQGILFGLETVNLTLHVTIFFREVPLTK